MQGIPIEIKKTITVAIPVFNGERFILETLQSVVSQTMKVDQILVSDNQSTDGTVKIIEQFAKNHKDFDLKININETNLGYQKNYNKCMELSQTDYLLLLSSDDRLKPFAIENQFKFLEKYPDFALVGGQVDFIDEEGNNTRETETSETLIFQKDQILEFIIETNSWINPATVLLNMKYIREIGYWDENTLGPDERYWPKVLLKHPLAIRGESILDFRRHKGQTGWEDSAKKYKEFIRYLKANLNIANQESDPERRKKTKQHLKKWAATRCIVVGKVVSLTYKKPWTGFKYWWFGFRQYPLSYASKYFFKSFGHSLLSRINLKN